MLLYLLFTPVILIIIFYLLMKRKERNDTSSVYKSSNGEIIPHGSIFDFPRMLFFGNKSKSYFHNETDLLSTMGPIGFNWQFFAPRIHIQSADLAHHVFKHTNIFQKEYPILFKEAAAFVGKFPLVLTNGTQWKHQRAVMESSFGNISLFEKAFSEKSSVLLKVLEKKPVCDKISGLTQKLALDILGVTIFGHDFNSLTEIGESKYLDAYNFIMHTLNTPSEAIYYLLKEKIVPNGINQKLSDAVNTFNELCVKLIDEKKRLNVLDESALSAMVLSQSQDDGMTDEELRDNVAVLFLGGHDTTAAALAFAIYNLAEYPVIQEQIRSDIQKVFGNENKDITSDLLKSVESLQNFIQENLRVFPPIPLVPPRVASEDTRIGEYFVPKGTVVQVNVHCIQNDKKTYGDPEVFRPDRWKREESRLFPTGSWIPFSSGSRTCLGMKFSLLEQSVFLGKLLTQFRVVKVDPKDHVSVDPGSTLLQGPKDFPIRFELL